MNSNTNINGSDNKVAGRDIHVHNYHHPEQTDQPSKVDEYIKNLQLAFIEAQAARNENRKQFLTLPSFTALIISSITTVATGLFVTYQIISSLLKQSEWTSIADAFTPAFTIHPALFVISLFALVFSYFWHSLQDQEFTDVAAIHKKEMAELKAKIQKIKVRVER